MKECDWSSDVCSSDLYAGIGLFILLLVGGLFFGFKQKSNNSILESENINLNKYRSEEIPADCRLPEYESNVESWKEHLGHHETTWHCLDYYN